MSFNSKHVNLDFVREWMSYDPLQGKFFWKKKRQGAKVGKEVGCVVDSRRVSKSGKVLYVRYRAMRINGVTHQAHRVIWTYHEGPIPHGKQIDHIDGDGLNNVITNLRLVDISQQAKNKPKSSVNTSNYVGVFRYKAGWGASISVDGKVIGLGTFDSKLEAAKARWYAEQKYGFHKNHGRLLPRARNFSLKNIDCGVDN